MFWIKEKIIYYGNEDRFFDHRDFYCGDMIRGTDLIRTGGESVTYSINIQVSRVNMALIKIWFGREELVACNTLDLPSQMYADKTAKQQINRCDAEEKFW